MKKFKVPKPTGSGLFLFRHCEEGDTNAVRQCGVARRSNLIVNVGIASGKEQERPRNDEALGIIRQSLSNLRSVSYEKTNRQPNSSGLY
jgi:hypothetical protein